VPDLPTLRGFIVGLVPTNPISAAVDGAMLPLIVFTLLFALAAAPASSTRNHMIVRAPSLPSERTSAKLVTLVNSSDTTSGTRTIRIAFTHNAPSGSTRPTSVSSGPIRAADTPIPAPRPTTSAASPSTAGDRRPRDASRRRMTR
jgi:hypothetical protein